MHRKDLMIARQKVPDLEKRWKNRRHELENRLEHAWTRLDQREDQPHSTAMREAPALYLEIARIDRSLSFLDRALVHLDDIERGGHHAESLPLAPASSANNRPHK